jgi:hypothetical protein
MQLDPARVASVIRMPNGTPGKAGDRYTGTFRADAGECDRCGIQGLAWWITATCTTSSAASFAGDATAAIA